MATNECSGCLVASSTLNKPVPAPTSITSTDCFCQLSNSKQSDEFANLANLYFFRFRVMTYSFGSIIVTVQLFHEVPVARVVMAGVTARYPHLRKNRLCRR